MLSSVLRFSLQFLAASSVKAGAVSSLHQDIEVVFRQLPDVAEVGDRRQDRQHRLRHRRVDVAEEQLVLLRREDVESLNDEK